MLFIPSPQTAIPLPYTALVNILRATYHLITTPHCFSHSRLSISTGIFFNAPPRTAQLSITNHCLQTDIIEPSHLHRSVPSHNSEPPLLFSSTSTPPILFSHRRYKYTNSTTEKSHFTLNHHEQEILSKSEGHARTIVRRLRLSAITEPHLFATVHGIITSLSPMKTLKKSANKYFDGRFADEDRTLRFIGFHSKHHQQLQQYYNAFTPISLAAVKIQKSSYSDELEICLQSTTNIDKSDRTFQADMIAMEEPGDAKTISIRDMGSTVAYQLVNVRAKVCKIFPPQKVATGQQKQDIIVSDATDTTRLTVWEDVIGTLQPKTFYIKVRVYKGKKYLSYPAHNASHIQIPPFKNIHYYSSDRDSDDDTDYGDHIANAEIIAIQSLNKYKACCSCNGKIDATLQPHPTSADAPNVLWTKNYAAVLTSHPRTSSSSIPAPTAESL